MLTAYIMAAQANTPEMQQQQQVPVEGSSTPGVDPVIMAALVAATAAAQAALQQHQPPAQSLVRFFVVEVFLCYPLVIGQSNCFAVVPTIQT